MSRPKYHSLFIFIMLSILILPVGISSNNSDTSPPDPVRKHNNILKFLILLARNPARGGVNMNKMGMTAFIMAASSMVMPKYYII